jgi:LytS/YehU family sensor histidine kinase
MRFEDSLEVDISDEAKTTEAKIIPLSLQLLLENAVKHNKVSEQFPLKIKIYIEAEYLIIENNLQPKIDSRNQNRNGIGLENIQSRYELFTNQKCEILKTEQIFAVKLPLLQLQNK